MQTVGQMPPTADSQCGTKIASLALRQVLEFRHVGDHHRRIDDAEMPSSAELLRRQRAADAANIPFGCVGKIRQFAVAEAAADDELSVVLPAAAPG